MRIQLEYFGPLRDERGLSSETVWTTAETPRELLRQLHESRSLSMNPVHLRLAVNGELSDWDRALAEDDRIVFLPPVSGG